MGEFLVVAIVCCVLWGIYAYVAKRQRWKRDYLKDWQAYNAAALHPKKIGDGIRRYRLHKIADECISRSGRLAVQMNGGGHVVHEVNKNGTFSRKDPYYIKGPLTSTFIREGLSIWQRTDRKHVVEVEVDLDGFDTTNPSGGKTRERGLRVLEYNTSRLPPVPFDEYCGKRDWDLERVKKPKAKPTGVKVY